MTDPCDIVSIHGHDRDYEIEYRFFNFDKTSAPLVLFLHEGLGSLTQWKNFPQDICMAANCRGLVYSRPGYGASTARGGDECWNVDFMHEQAYDILPLLLDSLDVEEPVWLLGHSDGASIALLYASRYQHRSDGIIVMAPHIMVEPVTIKSIEKARRAYLETDLRDKLARYHDDPDSAFWGWNEAWLNPEFQNWTIEQEITGIRCPILAVQGEDDTYGSMAQIEGIAKLVPQAVLLAVPDCGHSPHRDQPGIVAPAIVDFIRSHLPKPR